MPRGALEGIVTLTLEPEKAVGELLESMDRIVAFVSYGGYPRGRGL